MKPYDTEFRLGSVKLVLEEGRFPTQVADEPGVSEPSVRQWVKAYRKEHDEAFPGSGNLKAKDKEIRRLKEELRNSRMERDVLKSPSVVHGAPKVKYKAIVENRTEYPVDLMYRVFALSKSGYHEWRQREEARDRSNAEEQRVVRAIEAIHLGSKKNYGNPRVADLTRSG